MKNTTISWKFVVVLALTALLFVTKSASIQLGGTNAETGQPRTVTVPSADSSEDQFDQAVKDTGSLIPQALGPGAIAGFVALILNLSKLIPGAEGKLDGKSGTIATLLGIGAFIAVTVAGYFGYADRVKSFLETTGNALPGALAAVSVLIGAVSSVGAPALVHNIMTSINAQAFSFSSRPGRTVNSAMGGLG